MRARFPIPLKILVFFAANLAVLGMAFWFVFRSQFGDVSGGLFATLTGPAVQTLGETVGADLRAAEESKWEEVLAGVEQKYGVQAALFVDERQQVAGKRMELPEAFGRMIQEQLPKAPPVPRVPPPRREDFMDDLFGREFLGGLGSRPAPADQVGTLERGRPPRPGRAPILDLGGDYPKFSFRGGQPPAYWIAVRVPLLEGDGGYHPMLLVIRSVSMTGRGLFFDPKPWLYVGFGAVILSVLLWSPLALGLTNSLRRVTSATQRMAQGDFSTRVPDARRMDELGLLGGAVNQLGSRLDGFVAGQRRFMGDIAHELCSPIARMQASLGILEQQAQPESKQARHIGRLGEELQQMSKLVDELLSFSKSGLRQQELHLQAVDLREVTAAVAVREAAGAAVDNQIKEALRVQAVPDLLERALGNVLRNAVKYAQGAGPVVIRAERRNGSVEWSVRDHGPGVPDDELPRLFDAFYRPDRSRNRSTGGVGLGLAIVKSCVEACGGSVTAENAAGGGLLVRMTLKGAA